MSLSDEHQYTGLVEVMIQECSHVLFYDRVNIFLKNNIYICI